MFASFILAVQTLKLSRFCDCDASLSSDVTVTPVIVVFIPTTSPAAAAAVTHSSVFTVQNAPWAMRQNHL